MKLSSSFWAEPFLLVFSLLFSLVSFSCSDDPFFNFWTEHEVVDSMDFLHFRDQVIKERVPH